MKKQVKIISIILMVILIMASLSSIVLAAPEQAPSMEQKITDIGKGNATDTAKIENFGKTLVSIFQVIGIVVAVVILLVLGIKYMMGSAEEKAEYKKTMIPYLIGAALIFGSSTIVNVVYNVINSGAGQIG